MDYEFLLFCFVLEIARFELGLRMTGTDFSSLENLLTDGRNRKQLTEKFTFYVKRIPNFFEQILKHTIPFDPELLKPEAGKWFPPFFLFIQ